MSEQKREQLSAFMDGELGEMPSIADEVIRDPALGQVWKRYHLIGDIIQRNMPLCLDRDLAARISATIKGEPAIVAPFARKPGVTILKPVAGLAIAASVAMLAIFAVRNNQGESDPLKPEIPVAQQSPINQAPLPVRQVRIENTEPIYQPIPASSRLNSYLVNHNEYRTHSGMQGMLPYVRIVTYDKQD